MRVFSVKQQITIEPSLLFIKPYPMVTAFPESSWVTFIFEKFPSVTLLPPLSEKRLLESTVILALTDCLSLAMSTTTVHESPVLVDTVILVSFAGEVLLSAPVPVP